LIRNRCLVWVLGAILAAHAGWARPASAQSAPATATRAGARGLFGGGGEPSARQSLNVTFSLAEAYDDDALADLRPVIRPDVRQAPGYHTTLFASADYRHGAGRAVEIAASGASAFRYYNELRDVRSVSHHAALGAAARLPGRMTLRVSQNAAYSPSYLYGLFPDVAGGEIGGGPSAAPDYALDDSESYAYVTSSTIERGLGRRGRLSGDAHFRYTDYARETGLRRDVEDIGLRGEYRHGLSRNSGFTTGYGYRSGNFGYGADTGTTEHRVDVGIDYTRPFSATRRARVAFRVGGSAMDVPSSTFAVASGPQYRVQGDVDVAMQFARGWEVTAVYRRGLEYMPALTEPVYVDGFNTAIQGLLTRRLEVRAGAGYASGEAVFPDSRPGSRFDTYTGNLRLQVAATRTLAFFGEYLYYFYDFAGSAQLLPVIPLGLERNGVRGGLVLWLPVLGR
jgi:hypothetical protein